MSEPVFSPLLPAETVLVADLKPHPKNYQDHPEDQLAHLCRSLEEFGQYRNVVITACNTILAGHGVTAAAKRLGWTELRAVRVPLSPDDPRAIKLVIADNEVRHLAVRDDRLLADLLRQLKDDDPTAGLLGTGYDEMMLANLAFVTRPAAELADMNAAAHWAGLPGYDLGSDNTYKLVIHFLNEADRDRFIQKIELQMEPHAKKGTTVSTRWPWTERRDASSLHFGIPVPASA